MYLNFLLKLRIIYIKKIAIVNTVNQYLFGMADQLR